MKETKDDGLREMAIKRNFTFKEKEEEEKKERMGTEQYGGHGNKKLGLGKE